MMREIIGKFARAPPAPARRPRRARPRPSPRGRRGNGRRRNSPRRLCAAARDGRRAASCRSSTWRVRQASTAAVSAGSASSPGSSRVVQRLDMGVDLDRAVELRRDRLFEPARHLMREAERHMAVDLEIERHSDALADALDRDMMHEQPPPRRDHQHALQHRLVVERQRIGGDRQLHARPAPGEHRGARARGSPRRLRAAACARRTARVRRPRRRRLRRSRR